jgi:hypothetical protein
VNRRARWRLVGLLLARDVPCIADGSLPADAPRCRVCLRTVRPPARLPLRYRLFCQECYLIETSW